MKLWSIDKGNIKPKDVKIEYMGKLKDITGQRFGRLVAIRLTDERKNKEVVWECKCDCGNVTLVQLSALQSGRIKSCGCVSKESKVKDITGQRFGRLVAIRLTDERKNRQAVWECKCDCGNIVKVISSRLRGGHKKSCGCLCKRTILQIGKNSIKDITGQRFGRLVAIRPMSKRSKSSGSVIWECKCDCGNMAEVSLSSLNSTSSCGCLLHEKLVENGKRIDRIKQFGLIENTSVSRIKSQKARKNSTTGQRGVSYVNEKRKYLAQIGFKYKTYHLGYFDTLEEATIIRKRAEETLYGPFLKWVEENREDLFNKAK